MNLAPPDRRSGALSLRASVTVFVFGLLPLLAVAAAPPWWSQRGVLVAQRPADDYAPANQGQLKNIARAAAAEMDSTLPGGAGNALNSLVASWTADHPQTNDYAPLNLGQLKNVAKPFYDRLIAAGLATTYPWSAGSLPAENYAIANVGQVKNLFSFELPAVDPNFDGDNNGLPDHWERHHFGGIGNDSAGDADGDGILNIDEFRAGTDPTDFYNGILPAVLIEAGWDQRGEPGTILPIPITVMANSYGPRNAPLTFTVIEGDARLTQDKTGTTPASASIESRTTTLDARGYGIYSAEVYVVLPPAPGLSVIRVTATSGGRIASASTTAVAIDAALTPPTDLTVTPTSSTTAELRWIASDSSHSTTVQASLDRGRSWITVGVVAPSVTRVTVANLTAGDSITFRVFAGGVATVADGAPLSLPSTSDGLPPPPAGSGGGAATSPVEVTPLLAPEFEVDFQRISLRKYGYHGLKYQSGPYRTMTVELRSDYKHQDDPGEAEVHSTTQRYHWNEDGNLEKSLEIVGYGGFLERPITTVIDTDTIFRQEGAALPGYTGGSSRTITMSNLHTDAELRAEGDAMQPEFTGELWSWGESAGPFVLNRRADGYDADIAQYRIRANSDPNLVVRWVVQFTPWVDGRIGNPEYQIHEWATQGQTLSPVYELEPRKLNDGRNGSYRIVLLPVELTVDADRDGKITSGRDATSEEKPYRFWVNDDQDAVSGTTTSDEVVPVQIEDRQDYNIQSVRDCEDLARLSLNLKGITDAFTSGNVRIALRFRNVRSGNPMIRVFRSVTNGGREYLKSAVWAEAQIKPPFNRSLSGSNGGTVVSSTGTVAVDRQFWSAIGDGNPVIDLLFEGVDEGKAELYFELTQNGRKIGEGPGVWLDIKNVKKMYERAKAQPENIDAPYAVSVPFAGPTSVEADPNSHAFERPWDETKHCTVFVHGWNTSYAEARNTAETMFKRLWHQGYKGHFAAFRWDTRRSDTCLDPGEFNRSENRAYVYAAALKAWVSTLSQQYTINLVGHSMGNIVCSEALRQGMQVRNYALLQAALPMSAFDANAATWPDFTNEESRNPTPDYHEDPTTSERTLGYRAYFQNVRGRLTNFFNPFDWALATGSANICGVPGLRREVNWQTNQIDYKPDGTTSAWAYGYAPAAPLAKRGYLSWVEKQARPVTDSWEMKAFIARPRTQAVGVLPATGDRFLDAGVNLSHEAYDFGRERADHSGQYTRPIQRVDAFFETLRSRLEE